MSNPWPDRAAALSLPGGAVIDGEVRPARSGLTMPATSPRDGSVLTEVAACDAADVDDAVAAARRVFDSGVWSRASASRRRHVLLQVAAALEAHADELALLETLEVGKPIGDTTSVDVPGMVKVFRFYAEAIDKRYDEIAPVRRDALALVTREPLGVVGAVIPWNYPMLIGSWKVAPALATGNSVVLKPAEQASLAWLRIAEIAVAAGLPAGLLNVVPGYGPQAGEAIGRHMDVDKVAFTGSTAVGRMFQRYAGESNGKQVSTELGGKSPQLVLADVDDLAACATAVAWGIFYNAGQTCNAGSRLLVHADVHDDLVAAVVEIGSSLRQGDPLDPATQIGTIVDETQLGRVMSYVDEGRALGDVRMGGTRVLEGTGGSYLAPTLIDGIDNRSRVAQEEIFGPVLVTTTFRSTEEGVRLANATPYGLAAAVWTRDVSTAHIVARRLRAGTVWVNTFDAADVATPFGGFGDSGSGRDKSLHALDAYTGLKTTWIHLGKDEL